MSERQEIIDAIHGLCVAARTVQTECDFTPDNWGGRNKTGIERAARAERQALRRLAKLIGMGQLTSEEIEAIQTVYMVVKA